MSDLISRQAAIDAVEFGITYAKAINKSTGEVKELFKEGNKALNDAVERIKDLPSAQSEPSQVARDIATIIENEKDMRVVSKNEHLKTDKNVPFGEFVSRKKAIEAVKDALNPNIVSFVKAKMALEALPSAQPELIRINLNEPIKVKLTDWGKEIYYHQYDRTNQIAGREICKPRFPREDENGYTEFQLWCFIELYGMHMGMTLPNVIEPLEIVYER